MNKRQVDKVNIVVIGSTNTDMVIQAQHIPKVGETVLGGRFMMNQGGKGANQAVAAARLGAKVYFVGRTGKDIFGDEAIFHLSEQGIIVDFVKQDEGVPTGVATITVDHKGQNSIVVAPGANANVSALDIDTAEDTLIASEVILVQLEINLQTVLFVAEKGKRLGKKVILDPAPYVALPAEIYPFLFAITPNETEAEAMTGIKISNVEQAGKAAQVLHKKGVRTVIITMGEAGAFVSSDEFTGLLPVEKVKVVDTTAAGDTFNGALAVAIANGNSIKEAVEFANRAAAFSVTRVGAQNSCPTLEDLLEDICFVKQ